MHIEMFTRASSTILKGSFISVWDINFSPKVRRNRSEIRTERRVIEFQNAPLARLELALPGHQLSDPVVIATKGQFIFVLFKGGCLLMLRGGSESPLE